MVRPFRFFLETEMATECEACGVRFDLVKGGACAECRRVLCFRHLHGSWARRLATDFGARVVCVTCRSGARARARGTADRGSA